MCALGVLSEIDIYILGIFMGLAQIYDKRQR